MTKARLSTDQVLEAKAEAGSYAEFQQRLKDVAGKSVTVVLQEAGRTNIFTFTVK